ARRASSTFQRSAISARKIRTASASWAVRSRTRASNSSWARRSASSACLRSVRSRRTYVKSCLPAKRILLTDGSTGNWLPSLQLAVGPENLDLPRVHRGAQVLGMLLSIGRPQEQGEIAPEDLVRLKPEDSSGGSVEGANHAAFVSGDDAVAGGVEDGPRAGIG